MFFFGRKRKTKQSHSLFDNADDVSPLAIRLRHSDLFFRVLFADFHPGRLHPPGNRREDRSGSSMQSFEAVTHDDDDDEAMSAR